MNPNKTDEYLILEIKDRILDEQRKHPSLDWAYIAAIKIYKTYVPTFVPYSLCPKCGGQGIVSKPPYVAGDINRWDTSSVTTFTCNVCNGAKVIAPLILSKNDIKTTE